MAPDAPHRRPARPVADAPIDGLLARIDEVAKGWALTLVIQAPLHEARAILTEPLTRDGPRICDAALRALVDESDLRRLQTGGALRALAARVGEMTGSVLPSDVSRAVDALHDVLWSALREELRAPDPDLVSELAQRLSHVCAVIREAALEYNGAERELAAVSPDRSAAVEPPLSPPPAWSSEPESPWRPPAAGQGGGAGQPAGFAEASARGEPSAPSEPSEPSAAAESTPPGGLAPSPSASRSTPPLWRSALADEVRHAVTDGAALSLLLAELEDADRLAVSAPDQADAAVGGFTAAIRRVLGRKDILVHQSGARVWVIARETPRPGAHSLAARIAEAVGETLVLAGAPLAASVGVAVLGEDGQLSEELVDAAEEARFAASARGIEVSRRVR